MPSGASSVVYFSWEGTTYGGSLAASATNIPFGYGTKISTLSRANNVERIYGLGNRTTQVLLEKQFAGTFGIETVYSDPRILWAVFGDGSAAVTAINPLATINQYLDANFELATGTGVNAYTMVTGGSDAKVQPSFKLYNSIDATTNLVDTIDGCMVNNMTMSASVGDAVTMSLDGFFKTETFTTGAVLSSPTQVAGPTSFAYGHLEFPDNTSFSAVQNFSVSTSNNVDPIYGLGSRTNQTKVEKNREYEITSSIYFDDPTKFLAYAMTGASGGTSPGSTISNATLSLILSNKAANTQSTALEATLIEFSNVKIDTESLPQDITAPIMEDVTFFADNATVTVLNSTFTNFL